MKKNQKFKEFKGQNFLEVKFNKRNYDAETNDEAHYKYKKNVLIFQFVKIVKNFRGF